MTSAGLDEFSRAEEPARQLQERLGWCYVSRDVLAAERGSEREVLLKVRLRAALLRLNEWMTEEQADRVIFDLENLDGLGMARNQRVHEYLTYGMPLLVDGSRGRETRNVRFFDFDHPTTGLNEFVVTTQFRVRGSFEPSGRNSGGHGRTVVPDLVLFANGIPLVVMEAKAPSLLDWKAEAVRQLRRYQDTRPELFYYNLLCVAHCGADAAFGPVGAPERAYVPWKSVLPYSEDQVRQRFNTAPEGQAQLIVGLLALGTVLDILRDYVVFEPERGRLVKKLPRYQQYRTVTAAMERILAERRPVERGGVVWHTPGAGKSLVMLGLATKLRRTPRLPNPTIVVVTDRNQLDRQIAATFERCGFPAPERARTGRHLRALLTTGSGRTVMTTIQKFEDALTTPSGELDLLDASDDVFVMVDEAHRTQYGILGGRMSKALPHATLIGFTGTPIEKGYKGGGHSTIGRFGPLIDSYTIPQSVADGVTVPIHYQARLPELAVEGPATLDKLFEAMFGDDSPEVQERLRRRYANKETVAGATRRIEMIALDVADHFKAHVRSNGFKAQVVAPSRAAAVRYAERLNSFGVSAYPIITTDARDGPEFAEARELDQGQITSAFVDAEGEPEVLVVVDMLLTGFDAPVEQVLYLDRSLRDHGLIQAISRVNRPFSHRWNGVVTEKTYGLVVDYHGVSTNLEAALQTFDQTDVQEAMRALEEDPGPVIEAAAVRAEAHFKDLGLSDLWASVSRFEADAHTEGNFKADLFEAFNADYRQFSRLLDRYLPDPRALDYTDRLARLTQIRAYMRAQFLRQDAGVDWTEIGAKVKQLVDERISADVRELMRPVSILDKDFEQKIAALPRDEARASVMEHALRAQIHERLRANPAFYQKLSQQLERIIEDLRNRLIDSAEAIRLMDELRQRERSEGDQAAKHGLSEVAFAIYGLLDNLADEAAKRLSRKIEKTAQRATSVVDWRANDEVKRLMRRDIKRLIRPASDYTEQQIDEKAAQMIGLLEARSGQ